MERRGRRSGFWAEDGVVSVDWVVITSTAVIAGVLAVYFIIGPDGPVEGVVDAVNAEMDQASENISDVRAPGVGAAPGDGATD